MTHTLFKMKQTAFLIASLIVLTCNLMPTHSVANENILFQRVKPQFIAALGDPQAKSGIGAETWGIWKQDPGPRGVWLRYFPLLEKAGVSHTGWKFDPNDWWVDENGLLMEQPDFPVEPGRYLVTGEREVTTVLTIHPLDDDGKQRWELANGAVLHDVTHMPCRSARYTPAEPGTQCTPANLNSSLFKIPPGGIMPAVKGCSKQDYHVLIVVGKELVLSAQN